MRHPMIQLSVVGEIKEKDNKLCHSLVVWFNKKKEINQRFPRSLLEFLLTFVGSKLPWPSS